MTKNEAGSKLHTMKTIHLHTMNTKDTSEAPPNKNKHICPRAPPRNTRNELLITFGMVSMYPTGKKC